MEQVIKEAIELRKEAKYRANRASFNRDDC